jgi:hypothetical protein
MQTYSQALVAGQVLTIGGTNAYFRVMDAADPVDVSFFVNGRVIMTAKDVGGGMWAKPAGGFDRVDITNGGVPQTVRVAVSNGDAGYDTAALSVSGAVEVTNDVGNPLPVTVGNLPAVQAVKDVDAASVTDAAPVTVGVAATLIAAASAGRRALRITNRGTDLVYLGSSGVTLANGAIAIGPGETYHEELAAAVAWYGISATAGQSVRVQSIA